MNSTVAARDIRFRRVTNRMLSFRFKWLELAEDIENFRRCRPCGVLVRLWPTTNGRHLGHELDYPRWLTITEWLMIKLGKL